jgi:predicted dehydrogenase
MYEPVRAKRLALIGLGRHGARYAAHVARGDVPGVAIAAAWRRDREEGARQCASFGIRFEPDLDALLELDVDAFVVVIPAGEHLAVARAIASRNKPLLLEKPMARTVAEGEQIARAFEEAGAPLTIGQTLRFDPLTRALAEGAARFGRLNGFGFEQRLENRGLAWEDDPISSGGGVLIQTAIHTVDALRFVTRRELRVVTATAGSVHYQNNEDLALLHVRAGDALGDVRVSKIGQSRHMRFALFFEDGGLEADYIDRALYETRGRERVAMSVPESPTVPSLLAAFLAHLDGGPNPVPARDALESLRVIEAAYAHTR